MFPYNCHSCHLNVSSMHVMIMLHVADCKEGNQCISNYNGCTAVFLISVYLLN